MCIMRRNASIFGSRQQRNCCHTGRLSFCWSKLATSHCSPVLQLDYKAGPQNFWPLKLKNILTKVSCSTAIAGCRANPLEATQPISENPKFWSNQTGLTSCLKWLNWIWISFLCEILYVRDIGMIISWGSDTALMSELSFQMILFDTTFSVACLTSTLGIEDVWSHGSPGTTAQRSFFQQSLLRREGKPFEGVNSIKSQTTKVGL